MQRVFKKWLYKPEEAYLYMDEIIRDGFHITCFQIIHELNDVTDNWFLFVVAESPLKIEVTKEMAVEQRN